MLSAVTSSPFLRPLSPPIGTISRNPYPLPPSPVKLRPTAVGQFDPSTCLYDVLGIPMGASGEDIKSAYRRLAKTRHPDVAEGLPAEEFVRINAAYSTLSDPEKRADYDRRIFRGIPTYGGAGVSATGFSGYTCRNWETDQCW